MTMTGTESSALPTGDRRVEIAMNNDMHFVKTIWFSAPVMGRRQKHVTFVERDEANMNRASTIKDIMDGQIEDVVQVICLSEDGRWQDVTQEIAQDIVDRLDCEPTGDLFDFLESTLGCQVMADLHREMVES